ncbi:MAG: MGH1-like glycoside hydrolase domain-containing protein, partial [Planctomycetota bacterium]
NREALGHYFPEPDFWQTELSPHAPETHLTSGITMPPVHAITAEKIYMNARNPRLVLPFLKRIYPRLLRLHEFLYRERDQKNEGLVYIRHPWESGIDNSPTWDGPLKQITVDKTLLPPYERKDLKHGVDPKMRPSDDDYDRYVYLVDLFRKSEYNEARISMVCPFLIQDPLFNSILCRANESLVHIAELIGEDPGTPKKWAEKTAGAIRD